MAATPNVSLLWAANKSESSSWRVTPHRHPYGQIVMVVHGALLVGVEAEQRLVTDGRCVFIRGYATHCMLAQRSTEFLEAKFFVHDAQLQMRLDSLDPFIDDPGDETRSALARLVREGERRAPFYEEIACATAEVLLWHLARGGGEDAVLGQDIPDPASQVRDGAPNLVARVIEYMERNLEEETTLETLGKAFGYNPAYLCEKFSASAGKPPMRFLTELRLQRAFDLLKLSDLPIQHVAHATGFRSSEHFGRVFRKEVGVSPRRYRSAHRKRQRIEVMFCKDPVVLDNSVSVNP